MGIITESDLDPVAPAATATPTPSTPATVSPSASGPAAAPKYNLVSEPDLDPVEDHSGKAEALVRGGLQGVTFGTADEIGGALNALFSSRGEGETAMDHYRRERDKIRTANKASQGAHPLLYGAGEIGGGILPALATGGASVAAEGAAAIPEAVSVGKAAWTAAKAGAGYGALSGLGTSNADLTKGDVANAAYDTIHGAIAGGITGGILGAAGQKLSNSLGGAKAKQVESVFQGATRKALPADQPHLAETFEMGDKPGDLAEAIKDNLPHDDIRPTKSAKDIIAENLDVLKDLRSDDPKTLKAAAKAVNDRVSSFNTEKASAYKLLDQALDPETGIGPTNNDMVLAVEKMAHAHPDGLVRTEGRPRHRSTT